MSADKYLSIFSRLMEAIVYLCNVMLLYFVMLCYIMLSYVTLRYVLFCNICYVITLRYVML